MISANGGSPLQMKRWLCNAQWGQARLEAPSGSLPPEWRKGVTVEGCMLFDGVGGEIPVVSTETAEHWASAPTHALHSTADF